MKGGLGQDVFNETGTGLSSAVVQASSSKKRKKIDIADGIQKYSDAKMRDTEQRKQTLQFLKDDATSPTPKATMKP
jgi:hypothetical protein